MNINLPRVSKNAQIGAPFLYSSCAFRFLNVRQIQLKLNSLFILHLRLRLISHVLNRHIKQAKNKFTWSQSFGSPVPYTDGSHHHNVGDTDKATERRKLRWISGTRDRNEPVNCRCIVRLMDRENRRTLAQMHCIWTLGNTCGAVGLLILIA